MTVLSVSQEVETSETDSEVGSDTEGSSFDSSDETTVPVQSGPPQFVQKLIVFAAGLRLLLSAIMNTAAKVVVTILLGLAGTLQQLVCTQVYHTEVLQCLYVLPLSLSFFFYLVILCACSSVCVQVSHCPPSPQVCILGCFSVWYGGGCSDAPSACSSSALCV